MGFINQQTKLEGRLSSLVFIKYVPFGKSKQTICGKSLGMVYATLQLATLHAIVGQPSPRFRE